MSGAPGTAHAPGLPAPGVIPGAGADAPAGLRRYGVLIGGQALMLAGDGAVRVLDAPPAYRLPNTREWFLGLCNLRGTLVPVYDLAAWQGLPVPQGRRMLLAMGQGETAAGTLVDASPRHLLIPPGAAAVAAPPLAPGFAAHAGAAHHVAGNTWTDMDWPALFDQLKTLALGAQ